MSVGGTAAYEGLRRLPPLVSRAVELARRLSFPMSCRPEQGRLLHALASGRRDGTIGETGTGCGVGLAWMVDAAGDDARIVSVEIDAERAAATAALFTDHRNVEIVHGDWTALLEAAPFDLLVLDGGGAGKADDDPIDVEKALRMGGTIVVDDFTPAGEWPPTHLGGPDRARLHWLEHALLVATEIRLAPDLATVVGTRLR